MKVSNLGTIGVDLKNSDSVKVWIEYDGKVVVFGLSKIAPRCSVEGLGTWSFSKTRCGTHGTPSLKLIIWLGRSKWPLPNPSPSPPDPNTIKINTDGSSFGNPGISGYGGVFRNEHGHVASWFLGQHLLMVYSPSCSVSWRYSWLSFCPVVCYTFNHTLREGHRVADWLAKEGASSSCPSQLSSSLPDHALGFFYPRGS
ncbi:hypothetical protein glysoja_033305 [Glycine soja]|uniref:RNase H type-1 domain-containing protein n=1 Tax=Glycine soja TaxID=3848 RepID=A0A0B2Q272_GLYSO|nr:hypothetical protein glysoja_033305 [Glycine soja]